jgi:hypothetical protein
VYIPVNKLGLPICGDGPELPSILSWKMRRRREAGDAGAPACGLVFALTLMLIAEDF